MEVPNWLSSDNISAITAILAIAISIYSACRGYRAEKKYEPILELQKRISLLDLEEREQALLNNKKAILDAYYNKIGNSNKLIIHNVGKCDAMNVSISTSKDSPTISREIDDFNTSIKTINSMSDYKFMSSNSIGSPKHDVIFIKWDDEEKKGKTKTFNIKTY